MHAKHMSSRVSTLGLVVRPARLPAYAIVIQLVSAKLLVVSRVSQRKLETDPGMPLNCTGTVHRATPLLPGMYIP